MRQSLLLCVVSYLEHVLTHSAIHSVFEGLILEIELDVVIVGAVAHCDVKEDLDSALGYRSKLVWLAEFNVVSKGNSDGTKVS